MPWAALIPALASVAGGAIGAASSASDRDQAKKMQLDALQNFSGINTPELEQMKLALQQYQSAGQLDPRMVQAISQDPSLMGGIKTDPRLQQAQMQSLGSLQELSQGGLRPQDIAALNQVRAQSNQQANAATQAALQQMQARGQSGSGDTLAAALIASQGAANRAQQGGLDIGGQAAQGALQAISQAGNMASGMQGQQFGQQAQQASAQDVINRFNAQNSQQVNAANVAAQNQAQSQNLTNRQNIMNQNTGIANQQDIANKGLHQQNFANQMAKAAGQSGATGAAAGALNNNANSVANQWAGMGNAVNAGVTQYNTNKSNEDHWNDLKKMYSKDQFQRPASTQDQSQYESLNKN